MSGKTLDPAWFDRLESGLTCLDLSLPGDVCERLLWFIALLVKWNRAYNLTAIKDPLEMIERHLIDSLSILEYVHDGLLLDMGTGPGLPGIPLALALPESRFILLDSNSKKIRFVRQAVMELALENVQPVHARIENYRTEEVIDCLISRAFSSLPAMLELTGSLCTQQTRILAMKGTVPRDEIAALADRYRIESVVLKVPSSLGERHLIIITKPNTGIQIGTIEQI